jgi:catalase
MVAMLNLVDEELAARVAEGLGFREIPKLELPINHSVPGDGAPAQFEPRRDGRPPGVSPALSMANTVRNTVATRKVAILAADGVDTASLQRVKEALERSGAAGKIVAPRLGVLEGEDGDELLIDFSLLTGSSVLFDAVYVPGGAGSVAALAEDRDAIEFVTEAYRHCKPIAATSEGTDLLRACRGVLGPEYGGNGGGDGDSNRDGDGVGASAEGVIVSSEPASPALIQRFLDAIAEHRFWNRARKNRLGGSSHDTTRGSAPIPPDRRADEPKRLQT